MAKNKNNNKEPARTSHAGGEAQDDWEEGVIPSEFDFTMGLSPPGNTYNEDGIGIPLFQGNADFEFRFPKNRVYTTDPRSICRKI